MAALVKIHPARRHSSSQTHRDTYRPGAHTHTPPVITSIENDHLNIAFCVGKCHGIHKSHTHNANGCALESVYTNVWLQLLLFCVVRVTDTSHLFLIPLLTVQYCILKCLVTFCWRDSLRMIVIQNNFFY
jgi:hypothetical protein